ncbi:MAG TPA: AsmA family protein [Casimicrobiaceae bacterium]
MRRTALLILAIAGGLTALVLIAVAIAIATVDPKTLVGPVQARVKAETGRDLVFGGPIDLRLSLEPKLIASDVTLSNAPGARSPLMAQVKRVEVQVALLPLLQRRFEVVEVALVEPTIMLETDAQGRANWEFGLPSAARASAPTPPPVSAASVIAVGNIVIRDGKLTYTDGATGKTTNVTIGYLAMRSRKGDAPIDAEFRGKIDEVAVAVTGNLGPLDALREGRWPYPVAIKGDIAGRPANVSTKIAVQGETTTLDALDLTWGTLALKGQVRAVRANGRARYEFDLSSPSMSLQDAVFAGAAAAGPTAAASAVAGAKSAPPSRFVVSDRPLPLVALKGVDLDGTLAIGELTINERNKLRAVNLKVASARGKVDVPTFHASGYGGTLAGRVSIDAASANAPAVQLRIDGRDLDLDALLKAIGENRQVRGGKTAVTLDIAARGNSLHAWAASASGQALVTVGPATLVNTRIDLDDVLDKLSSAVNPYRQRDPSTELVCAVIRLPLTDGIARVDRSIAMETKKIAVSASGTLDFREEKLDFTLRPRVREGIPLDLPSFAELVHITGPFTHPAVKLDAVRSAATIAKIGAAISTGGLSVLGTSLIAKAADEGNECEVALGRQAPAATRAARTGSEPAPAQTIGSEVGKALGRIFGK